MVFGVLGNFSKKEFYEIFNDLCEFLSSKDNFISCRQCKSEQQFKEKYGEIILSCGSGKDDECGDQMVEKHELAAFRNPITKK